MASSPVRMASRSQILEVAKAMASRDKAIATEHGLAPPPRRPAPAQTMAQPGWNHAWRTC